MEVPLKGTKSLLAAAGLIGALASAAALAQPSSDQSMAPDQKVVPESRSRCFPITLFETWRAPDPHTMIIRVSTNRFFRIDMANACPALTWPGAHLITTWRTSGWVCNALDWDLKVSNDVRSGFAMPCIVSGMTEMSPQEVAQLPPRYRP